VCRLLHFRLGVFLNLRSVGFLRDSDINFIGAIRACSTVRSSSLFIALFLMASGATFAIGQAPPVAKREKANAASQAADILPCSGVFSKNPTATSGEEGRSVTLSWKASIPGSGSPKDAIEGYYIYRSLASHTYTQNDRLNSSLLSGIRCVDTSVKPHTTYFYSVQAVSEDGEPSAFSKEIKVKVPSHGKHK